MRQRFFAKLYKTKYISILQTALWTDYRNYCNIHPAIIGSENYWNQTKLYSLWTRIYLNTFASNFAGIQTKVQWKLNAYNKPFWIAREI